MAEQQTPVAETAVVPKEPPTKDEDLSTTLFPWTICGLIILAILYWDKFRESERYREDRDEAIERERRLVEIIQEERAARLEVPQGIHPPVKKRRRGKNANKTLLDVILDDEP